MMRKYLIVFIISVFISSLQTYGNAETGLTIKGPLSPEIETSRSELTGGVNRIKDQILDYFAPLSGVVEDVGEGFVKIRTEGGNSVKKGMRFSVFREGEHIYHPVTNESIGKSESFVGRIEVKDENPSAGLYVCTVISGDIKTGDTARITSSRVKLAFFQDKKADWKLSEVLYGALKDSGRFEILESYTSSYKPEDLSELARKLDAEAVLMFSTGKKDDSKLMNVKLFWAEDAKMFREIQETSGLTVADMFTPEEAFISEAFTDTEPWGRYNLSGGRLMAIGDVDGNGAKELVVSNGSSITIYDLAKDIREIWSLKGSFAGKHLSVDVLDLNNNGMAEIFVTSLIDKSDMTTDGVDKAFSVRSKMKSFVIEYGPSKKYRVIEDNLPYFMRVAGKKLLMQRFAARGIFSGPVYEGKWQEGSYQPDRALKLPDRVNIYGFTYVDWKNRGQAYVMTFDDNGYLDLYDESGSRIWSSDEKYGMFSLFIQGKSYSVDRSDTKRAIRGRLISIKTDRGQEVIAVNKIPVVERVPGFGVKAAEVYSLWWNDGEMEEKLIMEEVSGSIMDYWIEEKRLFLLARGGLFSIVENVADGKLSRGSVLYYYNFGE